MTRPAAKGWCPGAYRPMMSGDGLVVRVRPRLARLTMEQAFALCEAATRHGNGMIDLTSRANFQIRGVAEADHEALLQELHQAGLLDTDPTLEGRRNILVAPIWQAHDDTSRLAQALLDRLSEFPDLPAKVGFAVDCGTNPMLTECSADFRLERGAAGGLILRADGASTGCSVTVENAVDALIDMANWFVESGGPENRRMAAHLTRNDLPDRFTGNMPAPSAVPVLPGATDIGPAFGVAFGQVEASALAVILAESHATALRVTPWRMMILEGGQLPRHTDAITDPGNPLLAIDACPGAPFCTSATVETRDLARTLAGRTGHHLHVSGCAKGCARPRKTALTLVGDNGHFNLVRDGNPWDEPALTGLSPDTLPDRIGEF
ncbi:cobalamin biosynthesis protein CobG [Shimia biformata]|uniref:cobalamin biosynthesis protein CobG n=1 Tax=Shimia biformata TaxID=1294299 RepID=UPI001EF2E930|nr:cobalamin biosynthesis protein CobG [Shimia biformata]